MKSLLILALLAYQASTQELSSTLHSTVYGAQIVFVDERVVFTCVVRQSNSMAWRSDEYIGSGQRLSLSSAQRVNHSVSALGNNQTVAVLVNATTGTNSVVMSELHIRVKSTYPVASVQCVNSGTNTVTSTSFFLAGATQVTCDRQTVCSGSTITCTCITGNSDSLAWMSNGNRLLFTSTDAVSTQRNVSGSNSFAVLTENSNVNGIRVIMSNFTINNVSDSVIILTCENVDRTTTEPTIIPTIPSEKCLRLVNPTDQITTQSDPGNENASVTNASLTAAVIVLTVITFIMLAILIIFAVTCIMMQKRFKAKQEESEQALKKEKEEMDARIKAKEAEVESNMVKDKEESIKQLKNQIKEKDEEIKMLKKRVQQNTSQSSRDQFGAKVL